MIGWVSAREGAEIGMGVQYFLLDQNSRIE